MIRATAKYQNPSGFRAFVIPLDPPGGGGSGSPPSGPQPYDNNGVFEYPDGGGGVRRRLSNANNACKGDYVCLNPPNIVTLEKQYDSATGAIYYMGQDLTMDDTFRGKCTTSILGEEGGIGEYILGYNHRSQRTGPGSVQIWWVDSSKAKTFQCCGHRLKPILMQYFHKYQWND